MAKIALNEVFRKLFHDLCKKDPYNDKLIDDLVDKMDSILKNWWDNDISIRKYTDPDLIEDMEILLATKQLMNMTRSFAVWIRSPIGKQSRERHKHEHWNTGY